MKATGILLLLLVWHSSFSQWTDNFNDGNFDLAPSWSGNTADFTVEYGVLRLTAPAVSGSSFLSTDSEVIGDAEWHFTCQLDFNPSSSNYAEVYIVSDSGDLTQALNGYYVRIGSTSDDISLYKQTGNSRTVLIDGQDGRLSNSSNSFSIKVTRNGNDEFTLYSMLDGETEWHLEGVGTDSQIVASQYFGIKCNYTSTRSTKFYFDDFLVTGEPYQDKDEPVIDTMYTLSDSEILIQFNEEIADWNLDNAKLEINGISLLNTIEIEDNKLLVSFTSALDIINTLLISGFADLAGNEMMEAELSFIHYTKEPMKYGDIVINELMIDPSPPEDLPEFEYIELVNTSSKAIYMTGWSLSDKVGSVVLPDYGLLPNQIVLFSPKDAVFFYNGENIVGLERWISLNNSSDSISLSNENNELIDHVPYTSSWYDDADKSSGGWSLERIDPNHPCSGSYNWSAAIDVSGGTPGEMNSIYAQTIDDEFPIIKDALIRSDDSILVEFNEPIWDAEIDVTLEDLIISGSMFWKNRQDNILITTSKITPSQPYMLLINNIPDCFGNINPQDSVLLVLPEPPESSDIVISEILFNPTSNGSDFIEIYNQSAKYIDLNKMTINNVNNAKEIEFDYLFEPNSYLVLTSDTLALGIEYPLARLEYSRKQGLPAFNNDEGTAVLKNYNGNTIDSIRYDENWHFSYLTSFEGVSLERISPNQSGLTSSNWVSGSSENNFATPGYANWLKLEPTGAELEISPQIIVPDADGQDDFALISLNLGSSDALVSISIYNLQGQVLKELANNTLANRLFQVSWDGTDRQGAIVPLGHYIVVATTVSDNGTTRSYREKLVVGIGF